MIFLVLLLPSAQFAWRNRSMPQFGSLHDDGVLFVTAKSVAEGSFRLQSLPEQPLQTKFPPLYPAYLSAIWRVNANFPDNLKLATALSWLALAALLVLSVVYYGIHYRANALGQNPGRRGIWLCASLLAINPYLILFGCTMFSEVFFTCWVLAALLAIARPGMKWAVFAGLLAATAYLSRTAGIALLVAVPFGLALKREWKRAGVFAATLVPTIVVWMWWQRAHMPAHMDSTLMYYLNYTGYQFLNVDLHNFPVVLWRNLDQLLYGMGALVLPKIYDILPVKILTQVIAIGMISGVVRLFRRGIMREYAWFALASAGILVVWHFPPTERFVLPLLPLLVAGLVAELEHLASMLKSALRHKDASQRVAAVIMAALVTLVFGGALATQLYVTFVYLHESAESKAASLADQRSAYTWIKANLPRDANVLSYDDPLLYLYTGHRGNYLPLLTRYWYAEDHEAMVGEYKRVADYCQQRNLQYFYFTTQDLDRELGDDDRAAIAKSVQSNPRLTPVYHYGIGTVYRVD